MADSSREDHRNRWCGVDTRVAQWARVWNYLLGGKDNFAADRETGNLMLKVFPGIVRLARLQSRFPVRAVAYLTSEAGIWQLLLIGAGLPPDDVREAALPISPQTRIVFVDNDPMVLSHAQALLDTPPGGATSYIEADIRDPDTILAEAALALDLSQPVALVMPGILGQVPDSEMPQVLVRRYLLGLASGSCLALLDATDSSAPLKEAFAAYNKNSARSYHLRSPEQFAAFFDGLDLVPPGIVPASRWQPDDIASEDAGDYTLCGVAFKR